MSAPTAAPARHYGFFAKLWNFIVVALIFVLVGPPVGAITFLGLLLAWLARSEDPATFGPVLAFLTFYGVMFSWFVGALPAVITGAFVAVWQTFIGPMRWTVAALAGLCMGLAVTLVSGADIERDLGQPPMLPLYLLTCLAATMACWLMARSFVTAGRPE